MPDFTVVVDNESVTPQLSSSIKRRNKILSGLYRTSKNFR